MTLIVLHAFDYSGYNHVWYVHVSLAEKRSLIMSTSTWDFAEYCVEYCVGSWIGNR